MKDGEGRLSGILSLSDCQKTFDNPEMQKLRVGDIATRDVVTVTRNDFLLEASRKITSGDFAILPVVSENDPKELVGVIRHRDITSAFSGAMTVKRQKKA